MNTHFSSETIQTHENTTKYIHCINHEDESPLNFFRIIANKNHNNIKTYYTFSISINNNYFSNEQQKNTFVEKLYFILEKKFKLEKRPKHCKLIISGEFDNLNFFHPFLKRIHKFNKISIDDANQISEELTRKSLSQKKLKYCGFLNVNL